ncbi:hypothetical protein ACP70R_009124 [Stipagrostis hirtigluma subsp. patula]
MVRPELVDRHGIHAIDGPLLVGGVGYLEPRIGLFTETLVLEHIRSDQAFRDYLELRHEAFKKVATELVAAFSSPDDLFFLTDLDVDLFQRHYFDHMSLSKENMYLNGTIVDDDDDRSAVANMSTDFFLNETLIRNEKSKAELLGKVSSVRRYYAYRKSLLKLDIQWNSDPEEVLEMIKSSTRWSELDDRDLKRGLKSHMDLLKEYKNKLGLTLSEYENVAVERINSEMGSELEKHLCYRDQWLMEAYYHRMKLRTLARECSIEAEKTGIILAEELFTTSSIYLDNYLSRCIGNGMNLDVQMHWNNQKCLYSWTDGLVPVREHVREPIVHMILCSMKQAVKQFVEGWIGYLRRGCAVRDKYDPRCGMSRAEFEWRCDQGERVSQRMPELLRDMKILTQRMRPHFQDDPAARKLWDEHEAEILNAFKHRFPNALASPANLPPSVLYKHLMKRKACSSTFIGKISRGLNKFKQATKSNKSSITVATIAGLAGFAVGLSVRPVAVK